MTTQAQINAYKKAHKNQNMAGMFDAAGGDITKLSGLHRAAYPKAKAAAPRPTTRGVTTAKKTGTMAGRGQMATVGRAAASPKPATRGARSVAQAPRPTTRGTRATGGPRASARGVRASVAKPKYKAISAEASARRRAAIKKTAQSIAKAPTKALRSTRRWASKVSKQGFTL